MTPERASDAIGVANFLLWNALVKRLQSKGLIDGDDVRAMVRTARDDFETSAKEVDAETQDVFAILDGLAARL